MSGEPLLRELIARLNMKTVPVDLDVTTDGHVGWGDETSIVSVSVLIFASLQEFTLHDTGVLLCGFIDGNGIISEEEGHNKTAVDVFWDLSVESGDVSQHCLVVVYILEEVTLWLFRQKLENITEGINLITETVVGWDLSGCGVSWLRVFDLTQGEVTAELCLKEVLSELVNTLNIEITTIGMDVTAWHDLVIS